MQQSYQPMPAIRGLDETFVRSSADGTMQPVAVYVPATYVPGHPAPLVVFLHGLNETETELLGPEFLHKLADRDGAIVVAPYARADFDYTGSESDVYDALAAAESAFTIDERKHYLAGFSMGGFAVYRIAPMKPLAWAGVMSISGSLLQPEAAGAAHALTHDARLRGDRQTRRHRPGSPLDRGRRVSARQRRAGILLHRAYGHPPALVAAADVDASVGRYALGRRQTVAVFQRRVAPAILTLETGFR